MIADHAEGTLVLLRYSLGGNRPSQTDFQTLFHAPIQGIMVRISINRNWYFTNGSTNPDESASKPPSYTTYELSKPNVRSQ
jgi:hypothetical protein